MARLKPVSPLPWLTLALLGFGLLVFASHALHGLLIYDRALIADGEVWRLLSGQWVHFSPSHLVYNLLVVGVAGAWLERCDRRGYGFLLAITVPTIGLYCYLFLPDMMQYGGLSGVATALVVYLALREWQGGEGMGLPWLLLLGLVGFKLSFEILGGSAIFASSAGLFQVVPQVHVVGTAVALLLVCRLRLVRRPPQGCGKLTDRAQSDAASAGR